MGVEDSIMDDIKRKQVIWYGHVQRMKENSNETSETANRMSICGKTKKRKTQYGKLKYGEQ